ncbi:MAG: sn-glycerol-3-phosphate ABC transporter ATP-binding protein UgpC [Spirochaetales bacterium]|jgi:multiple sugar transport system ATP-binding protein|nr:sn-glycerol-3-phosphate ABC transporter ATP-binding protein UgpC [Spirochaetales bacterium]
MATVELRNISKVYEDGTQAVNNVNLTVHDKEFVVFVGPSGCGKTTTLRMIAGLEEISGGDLTIDEKRVNDIPPKDRDIAMVFQNYALYPHMSVYNNMAFSLKIRKLPKGEIDKRVKEAAKILDIETLLNRKPKALSGGERQRVAVGRAIVRQPKVFLFDEPLSNLDAKLRVQMRAEIAALHNRLQATMIYVTHDQVEAMTMGDRIVVMKDGVIQQIGGPLHLYNHPENLFVAGFIGSPPMNFFPATVIEESGGLLEADEGGFRIGVPASAAALLKSREGQNIVFGIRPEDLVLAEKEEDLKTFRAVIRVVEPLGSEIHLYAKTGEQSLIARVPPHRSFKVGETVSFSPNPDKLIFFDPETGKSLFTRGSSD